LDYDYDYDYDYYFFFFCWRFLLSCKVFLVEGHVHEDTSQGEEYPAHRQLDRADMTPESIPDALG